ncbi:hypothetical protein B9Z55_017772 [Caenorhabditis nigoni]|uniref:G-protein coupled receptors family 1 profile domain-containing protein n=3 Tax=Caenorhabditis nigoni TaxID=1611254 RepID=A0A2G5TB59_9PELO|nr:hypothetical protein B9Z55_017772 [Caenorhabditis nigoni]
MYLFYKLSENHSERTFGLKKLEIKKNYSTLFKTIVKAPELALFYWHFGFDIVCSLVTFTQNLMIFMFVITTQFEQFYFDHPNFAFYVFWPVYLLGNMRALLLLIIALDRTVATYFPIKFFKYRKLVPSLAIVAFVLLYGVFDVFVLFGICGEVVDVPVGCVMILCGVRPCYVNYWLNYEKTVYTLVIALCSLLSFKLFVWNKCQHLEISKDLKRANRLALIDTFIIIFFDLLPPVLVSYVPNVFYYLGVINTFFKSLGYVVERCLIAGNLNRKYKNNKKSSVGPLTKTIVMN